MSTGASGVLFLSLSAVLEHLRDAGHAPDALSDRQAVALLSDLRGVQVVASDGCATIWVEEDDMRALCGQARLLAGAGAAGCAGASGGL